MKRIHSIQFHAGFTKDYEQTIMYNNLKYSI